MFETHPDLGGDESEFVKARDAYLTLRDDRARLEYDMEEPKRDGYPISIMSKEEVRIEGKDAAVEKLCWWKEPWTIVSDHDRSLLDEWVEMLMSAAHQLHWEGDLRVGLTSERRYSVFDNMALIGIGMKPEKHMAYTYILWRMTHA